MTDEAKALVAELRLNDSEIYLPLLGKAADRIEALEAENARLREKLMSIMHGAENGEKLFADRQGNRAKPIWYAVNVLQDHLSACKGTARAALAGKEEQ